jgi:hypothetical protein
MQIPDLAVRINIILAVAGENPIPMASTKDGEHTPFTRNIPNG